LALGGASQVQDQRSLIEDQKHLVRLQAKELAHELKLRHWSLQLRHASAILKFALEVSIALIGLALAAFIAMTVWNAAHADGLIVESFKVPPDLVEKGLSGDVVASRLLDQLSAFQAQSSNAIQAPSSIANSWSDDLKVEIPETGVSLGEFNRYLRRWLGHETHISGEVVRLEGSTIEITARVNSEAGQSFSGSDGDFHALVAKAAEAIYAATQPTRYGNVLNVQGRFAEQESFLLAHTRAGSASERAWAYSGLASLNLRRNKTADAIRYAQAGVTLSPAFGFGWYRLAQVLLRGDALQGALDAAKKSLSLTGNGQADLLPIAVAQGQAATNAVMANALGDFEQQIEQGAAVWPMIDFTADPVTQTRQAENATGGTILVPIGYQGQLAIARIGQHDLGAARRVLAQEPVFIAALKANPVAVRRGLIDGAAYAYRSAEVAMAMEARSWGLVRKLVPAMEVYVAGRTAAGLSSQTINLQAVLWPALALAQAQTGDFAAAHAQIDKTAPDCDLCLRTRAKIDALQKNFAGADFWLARLEAMEPSIPFADEDWGRSLLARGQLDGAIEKFKLASQKGPHFADPPEGWGEALMAQSRSDLALAKFAEADKYAPNWGRLHLKWGEALAYTSKPDEAKKQFAIAAGLDLTPGEKAELARQPHHA
jgi:tetratricopeptide (TPR) repeat protein